MYTPTKFKVEDPEAIRSFIKANSFGLLLTVDGDVIHDTHTPFVQSADGQNLVGHIAKANPQWKCWGKGTSAKVIFTGPHSYISPHYYESAFAVPTWNYTAVSISGKITIIEEEEKIIELLDQLTAENESSEMPWKVDWNDERYVKLLSGIVVFSVSMDCVEASFKMNQNKSLEDQKKVVRSLLATGNKMDEALAHMMSQNIERAERGHGVAE